MEKQNGRGQLSAVVFDSGIGGLNLLYACALRRPDVHYYYISDNDNVPYGNRSDGEIYALTLNALQDMERLSPSALIVACNTVTARCIDRLRSRYPFPVIGIQPAVKQAAAVGGRCLVLATESTVKSSSFTDLLARCAPPETSVFGCRELAGYIEQNIFSLPDKLPRGLLPDEKADSVVLGCTHYTFVHSQIEGYYNCPVFDGVTGTADHFAEIIGKNVHFNPLVGKIDHDRKEKFKITFLRGNIEKNKQIFEYLFTN